MFICVCNAIRESEFRAVAGCCRGDAEEIYAQMGKRTQCGQCLEDADEVVAEERFGAPARPLVAA